MNAIDSATGDDWALYHGDTVEVAREIPDDSIELSIFSPPFASLYESYWKQAVANLRGATAQLKLGV